MSECPYCTTELPAIRPQGGKVAIVGCRHCLNVSVLNNTGSQNGSAHKIDGVECVADLAPSGSVMTGVLLTVYKAIEDLPVLAEVPQRVIGMVHDPLSSLHEIADVVHEDAVMSMKVLSLANSAYFAAREEIGDLYTACSRLGMKTINNIAYSAANGNIYRGRQPAHREVMERLWRHAVATAHAADELSNLVPGLDARQLFVGGLMHDAGKIVMFEALTNRFGGDLGRLKDSPETMARVLDRFAPLAGLHVLQYWKMPPDIIALTYFLHSPEKIPDPDVRRQAYVVSLADCLANNYGYGVADTAPIDVVDHPCARALGIDRDQIDDLKNSLDVTLDAVVSVLAAA